MNGLLTDLYELTMAAGFFNSGRHQDRAVFEMFIRRLPRDRDWVLICGIERAIDYLVSLSFDDGEIRYLQTLPQFTNAPQSFWQYLREFRFTGDVDAVPEGTILYAGEPVLTVRAPLIEGQIPETWLLSAITFETLIATKAARVVQAAKGRLVQEFGTRRAHTPEAGTLGARAAYIAGCAGTSNTLAGYRYGIPVFGTAAHSWVMSFGSESEAFRELQSFLAGNTVQLLDTYDTLEGARHAAELGPPLWGVRIDSGDLGALARQVRVILDRAGLTGARIVASGDLDEHKIAALVAGDAPIDAFGVGTELATSADAPAMGMIYKLVEITSHGRRRLTAKHSPDKPSLPGAKQIWRASHTDTIALSEETVGGAPLLRAFVRDGYRVSQPESLPTIRSRAAREISRSSPSHKILYSVALASYIGETEKN